jgi:hypothetical protein
VRTRVRRLSTLSLGLVLLITLLAQPAMASKRQLAMFEDDFQLQANPEATLDTFKSLGVGIVRVYVAWNRVAPFTRPAGFNPSDPNDPHYNWAIYDQIVRDAQARGLIVDLTLGAGAPPWANGRGAPKDAGHLQWKPDAAQFGAFVHAAGLRYDGRFTPTGASSVLPPVHYWAIWNEPNFGMDLGPQATNGSRVLTAPIMYRSLVDRAYASLQTTHHNHDTILIGSLAARGSRSKPSKSVRDGRPGNFGTTKPLQFIRALYCVDTRNRPLRGAAARAESCPTNAARSRAFRRRHPGLFAAGGFAVHPYPVNQAPNRPYSHDSDYAEFPDLPHFTTVLDAVQRTYGSRKKYPIYITEYGYITNPPNRSNHYPSPATAAYWINWAEYLMWRNPRVATTMQYLLEDPNPRVNVPEFGGFADGLEFFGGKHKPTYDAYRMPLYLPSTTQARRRRRLEVWGCVRPARYAQQQTHKTQRVQIQFQKKSRGSFRTLRTMRITDARGYFDLKLSFPSSGSLRLAWSSGPGATTLFSRTQKVTVR